ncbi:MAG: hypothetical protein JWO26_587 [Rhodospirillales bacterium]|nr:hypothetical protein [Rhodospirillales bacterium]
MRGCSRRGWSSAVNHGARLGAMLILLALPAQAEQAEYSQRGVPAEATAENGVVARDRALASARRIAWGRVAGDSAARNLSDGQIEALVESIVIEEERTGPTRYTGVVTVNFRRSGSAAVLSGVDPATALAPRSTATVATVEAVALYGGMTEWLELRRRLAAAPEVARIDVVAIAVDRARLRIALRAAPPAAAEGLAAAGIVLAPQSGAPEAWRVGLGARS